MNSFIVAATTLSPEAQHQALVYVIIGLGFWFLLELGWAWNAHLASATPAPAPQSPQEPSQGPQTGFLDS